MNEKPKSQVENQAVSGDDEWQAQIRRAQLEREEKAAPQPVDNNKSIVKLLVKGVFIGALCLGLLFAWVYADNALLPFDAAAWKANVGREKQVGRLQRQVPLVGMTREQVVQLLGKPNRMKQNALLYIFKTERRYVYYFVLFFEEDKVISHFVRREDFVL